MTGLVPEPERFSDPAGARRIAAFIAALSRFPTGHLLDLGAGHGIFSLIASDLGWRVTAVDVRDVRFPEDSRVRWVTSDVRDFDGYGDVDVVACLGLWYHLTLADHLALLRRIAPRPLILDTHVAREDLRGHPVHGPRLSAIRDDDGYAGRLYFEGDLQDKPTASWGNDDSFWPTVRSLQRQLESAGYDAIERMLPEVAADREYVVARILDSEVRARIDEMLPRYDPLRAPTDPAPDPTPNPAPTTTTTTAEPAEARPTEARPTPWTARRVAAGVRRRLRRR
jgi:SAM-dependent methyltransferase